MNGRDLSCEPCSVGPPGEPEGAPILRLVGVDKVLDGKKVLDNIDLDIPRSRITAIIGLSGAGKSVMLKHMIGLLKPDRGQVLLDGVDLCNLSRKELYKARNRFGMLFQSGALFDSLDVFENVAFPLREKTNLGEGQIRERVQVLLRKVWLEGAAGKFPDELSGGMVRRVALARAMVMTPRSSSSTSPRPGSTPSSGTPSSTSSAGRSRTTSSRW